MDVAMLPSDHVYASAKGRWAAFVPDHDFEELCWENGQLLVVMPGQNIKSRNQPASPSLPRDDERVPAPVMGEVATENAGTLEAPLANDHDERAGIVPAGIIPDEEMVGWLQYPPDDEALMNYCPELMRVDVSNSAVQSAGKDCGGRFPAVSFNPLAETRGNDAGRPTCTTVAMNTIPYGGNTADTTTATVVTRGTRTSRSNPITQDAGATTVVPSHEMLPSKMQPVTGKTASMNFSRFSKPAVTIKASLHDIGRASGPLVCERLKQLDRVLMEACMPIDSLIRSTDSTERSLQGQREQGDTFQAGYCSVSQCLTAPSILRPAENFPSMNEGDAAVFADDESASAKATVGAPNGCRSCLPGDAAISGERVFDALEPTMTSSGGSGHSAGKHDKFCSIGGKRKAGEVDDFDIQSEAPEDYFGDVKKPPSSRSMSTKRARAAEVHNQSERRRRDRINEKMKALQELIPNANKTDKASLLEEAIKYLKSLQSQLQMMAYRTGVTMSPKWIPLWVPQMQMRQMASPQAGMGMACGMGMGMRNGIMGMGATSRDRHILPSLPGLGSAVPLVSVPTLATSGNTAPQTSLPGPFVSPATHFPPVPKAGTPLDSQLQNSKAMNYRTLALPHPVHDLLPQPGRRDTYNSIMLQQHQHPKK